MRCGSVVLFGIHRTGPAGCLPATPVWALQHLTVQKAILHEAATRGCQCRGHCIEALWFQKAPLKGQRISEKMI